MKKSISYLALALAMVAANTKAEESDESNQALRDARITKCEQLKKQHQEYTIELEQKKDSESLRADFLQREIPRVRSDMEYFCNER